MLNSLFDHKIIPQFIQKLETMDTGVRGEGIVARVQEFDAKDNVIQHPSYLFVTLWEMDGLFCYGRRCFFSFLFTIGEDLQHPLLFNNGVLVCFW